MYQPVTALIVSRDVQFRSVRRSSGYVPIITYHYEVGGNIYRGQRFNNYAELGSREWANAAVERYRDGQAARAYYNPSDAADSFLSRDYHFEPYGLLLLGVGLLIAWVLIVDPPRGAATWIAVSLCLGLAALAHYFAVAHSP